MSLQPGQPGRDPVSFLARHTLTLALLVDDSFRGLGHEVRVTQFCCGRSQFLVRGGQVLLQAATLGGHVDGARGVEFDDDVPPLSPTSSDAEGLKSGPGSVSHANEVTAPIWVLRSAVSMPDSRADTFCRSATP